MPGFELPLVIETADHRQELLLRLPAPRPWGSVRGALLREAGIPEGLPLYCGRAPVHPDAPVGLPPLLAGTVLRDRPWDEPPATGSLLVCIGGPRAGGSVQLPEPGSAAASVLVGRGPDVDLVVDDPRLRPRHLRVDPIGDGWRLTDLGAADPGGPGVVVIAPADVDDASSGPSRRSEGRVARWRTRRVRRRTGRPDRLDRADRGPQSDGAGQRLEVGTLVRVGASLLQVRAGAPTSAAHGHPDGAGRLRVIRPPRARPPWTASLPPRPGPPPERSHRPLPLLAAVVGGLLGATLAVITGMWWYLLFAAIGPISMLATALGDRWSGRRSTRRALVDHGHGVRRHRAAVRLALEQDRVDTWDRHPDPAELLTRVRTVDVRVWERRTDSLDFGHAAVGTGRRAARLPDGAVDDPTEVVHGADGDPAGPAPGTVSEVPIVLDVLSERVVGLAGRRRPLLRWVMAQLAATHSPADLAVLVVSRAADLAAAADLPHCRPRSGGPATVVADGDDAAAALDRVRPGRGGGPPALLVLLDDADHWRTVPAVAALLTGVAGDDPAWRGVGVLATCGDPHRLPAECRTVGVVGEDGTVRIRTRRSATTATVTGIDAPTWHRFVAALAPLRDGDGDDGLPRSVALASLTGLPGADAPRPRGPARVSSASAVLGSARDGVVTIDLDRHGPHLLIAGTTGSGKSELLQTLVVGLATAAPPWETSLVLIDYKGGATFGPLAGLPHTASVLTDLDERAALRALTGLRAELHRRERVLARVGHADLRRWRAAARGDETAAVPPRLVVLIDEFATLVAEVPDFLPGLVDVARRGRSLGVHLVLATQRPGGAVPPDLRANVTTRISLRTADVADSREVLDVPDAAWIPPDLAGRAILRVGSTAPVLLQTAQVRAGPTAPITPAVCRRDDRPIRWTPLDRVTMAAPDPDPGPDWDRVTAALVAAAGGRRAAQPWLPPLPDVVRVADLAALGAATDSGVLGLVDEPERHRRRLWRPGATSLLVVGTPGSGRSSTLRRVGQVAASSGGALVVLDGTGGLADLRSWPAVSTHLGAADADLFGRAVQRLTDELHRRSPPTGPDVDGGSGPAITVLVDGWETVTTALDAGDFGVASTALAHLAAHGAGRGVVVVACGATRLTHHRHAESFAQHLTLGPPTAVAGRPAARRPGRPVPGRGRSLDADVQIVLTGPDDPPPRRRPAAPGPVIRRLAMSVDADDLPAPTRDHVWVGLGGDAGRPVGFDLAGSGGAIVVAGPTGSGVRSALRTLAGQAATTGLHVVVVGPSGAGPATDDTAAVAADDLADLLARHSGPILLVSGPDPAGSPTDPRQVELLRRFARVAGPGQWLAAGHRLGGWARGGLAAELAAARRGVLLQPDPTSAGLFGIRDVARRAVRRPGAGLLLGGVAEGNAGPGPDPVPVQLLRPAVERRPDATGTTGPTIGVTATDVTAVEAM
ncbi:FtsK/SpoIIIE domain-containing protein [Nakamurella leprariae]|uniref:FtsK domain-containing protein n=1 Tax=Nakamurella leprariae TaxID=2803911 RepID=A0A939C2F8_9ACTN|nr:FtsK/SpoIIIE domain-containing protein [Nakamurella leprariae]MBM9468204.1 hypothetical protein [Nakamurella leprariae]